MDAEDFTQTSYVAICRYIELPRSNLITNVSKHGLTHSENIFQAN